MNVHMHAHPHLFLIAYVCFYLHAYIHTYMHTFIIPMFDRSSMNTSGKRLCNAFAVKFYMIFCKNFNAK